MRRADTRDADLRGGHAGLLAGGGLALLARHRLLRIVAGFALLHAGSVEETRHAVRGLRALGQPGLGLVEVELQTQIVVLGEQRIEVAETLDEAAVAGETRVGDDHVIDGALLGAGTGETDDGGHGILLKFCSFECEMSGSRYFFFPRPGKPPSPGSVGLPGPGR